MLLPTVRAKRFSIAIKINNEFRKIFHITFHTGKSSSDTHILVSIPYLKKTKGILSKFSVPATNITVSSISYLSEAKRTSHLIKFNHPIDGNAHFSGDGQIKTKLWNKSRPLNSTIRNIFTIQFQGFDEFEVRDPKTKRLSTNITDFDFDIFEKTPKAVRFIGRWIKATNIKGSLPQEKLSVPVYNLTEKDGTVIETGCIISPLGASPFKDYVLLLSCAEIPLITTKTKDFFSLLGGFDEKINVTGDVHFLGCVYPIDGYEHLFTQLENIDFNDQTIPTI